MVLPCDGRQEGVALYAVSPAGRTPLGLMAFRPTQHKVRRPTAGEMRGFVADGVRQLAVANRLPLDYWVKSLASWM
jgi:hypothetical protein